MDEYQICEKVETIMRDNQLYGEVGVDRNLNNLITVYISGDWKHDHLRLKFLLQENGFLQVNEVAEPSDEDYYTSTHYFVPASGVSH